MKNNIILAIGLCLIVIVGVLLWRINKDVPTNERIQTSSANTENGDIHIDLDPNYLKVKEKYGEDIANTSMEFKRRYSFRQKECKKIFPCIHLSMKGEEVEELLGKPYCIDIGGDGIRSWYYPLFYSSTAIIYFDEHGKVIHKDWENEQYANGIEEKWPFIRPDRTKKYVMSRLGDWTTESSEGKRWHYVVDGRTYTVIFDDNNLYNRARLCNTHNSLIRLIITIWYYLIARFYKMQGSLNPWFGFPKDYLSRSSQKHCSSIMKQKL